MKKAFTLAEVLICLGIIGVVAIMIIANMNKKPNNSMVLFRKAYNTTSNNIAYMLENLGYYSDSMLSNTDATTVDVDGKNPSGATKFCEIYASIVTIAGDLSCAANSGNPNAYSFKTPDGIAWRLPPKSGTPGDWSNEDRLETIWIDVNGESRPNCADGTEGCNNPDQFVITVTKEGKLKVTGRGAEYLKSNSKIVRKGA